MQTISGTQIAVPKKQGRPTIKTDELLDTICKRIALGESMRSVCRDDGMPTMESIWEWLRNDSRFVEQYERAAAERTDAQQELLLEIGDDAIAHAESADPKAANAVVNAYKLKSDALRWSMSKMKPKKYGDKVDITSDGRALPTPIYNGSSQGTIESVKYITLEEKTDR